MGNKKGSTQLKWEDRVRIESLLLNHISVAQIAQVMGRHRSTIYKEIKRGRYVHRNSDYTEEERYSPEIAQEKAEEGLRVRGTQLKIRNDLEYAKRLEHLVLVEGYSPPAAIGYLKASGECKKYRTSICEATFYSYIDKHVFLYLSNKDLPEKGKRKRIYRKVQRRKRPCPGESIENRPQEVRDREEFGHWEMDSVVGQVRSKNTLLVLTERKTRKELIFKLPDHTAGSVVAALDALEGDWGADAFQKIFRTITVDNGTEFSDVRGIERSALNEGEQRTRVFYCHPYSSWERGSNECANRMIRRKIPKGTNFDDKTDEEIREIETWINTYPRKIHGYRSAAQVFEQELMKLA